MRTHGHIKLLIRYGLAGSLLCQVVSNERLHVVLIRQLIHHILRKLLYELVGVYQALVSSLRS